MRLVESVTVVNGQGSEFISSKDYDVIKDETIEFSDHTEVCITCYNKGISVRRLWNIPCDIKYKV